MAFKPARPEETVSGLTGEQWLLAQTLHAQIERSLLARPENNSVANLIDLTRISHSRVRAALLIG
jgi:hypothetical protein